MFANGEIDNTRGLKTRSLVPENRLAEHGGAAVDEEAGACGPLFVWRPVRGSAQKSYYALHNISLCGKMVLSCGVTSEPLARQAHVAAQCRRRSCRLSSIRVHSRLCAGPSRRLSLRR